MSTAQASRIPTILPDYRSVDYTQKPEQKSSGNGQSSTQALAPSQPSASNPIDPFTEHKLCLR